MLALDKVTRDEFAARLNENFVLITATGGITLRLVEAKAYGDGHPGRRVPFSLRFQGAPGLRLPQQIHRLENATLGTMEIFLVQIGADAEGSWFEAVFN